MKQQITTKQRDELNEEGQNTLRHWVLSKGYVLDTKLSIGQMIEFLEDNNAIDEEFIYAQWDSNNNCPSWVVNSNEKEFRNKELRIALWKVVKEVLNEKFLPSLL